MARLTFQRTTTATQPAPCRAAPVSIGVCIEGRAAENDATFGSGWFESTWDLWSGLDVREEALVPRGRSACRFQGGRVSAALACAA